MPKVEKVLKSSLQSTSRESSMKPTVPIEVKKIEKIKPNVEEKSVKAVIDEENDNLKKEEGINY